MLTEAAEKLSKNANVTEDENGKESEKTIIAERENMKIDVSGIEGYAEMTPEQKVAALEGLEIDDHAEAVEALTKYKDAMDKANHDAAESKRQLKAMQDAQAKGATKADQTIADLQKQVAELTRANTISAYVAQYSALGYSAELAKATAEAQADGDVATVMANQQKFLEDYTKNIKAELLKGTPAPKTGTQPTGMTKEKFKKLSFAERMSFASEHPEEYKKFYEA